METKTLIPVINLRPERASECKGPRRGSGGLVHLVKTTLDWHWPPSADALLRMEGRQTS